MEEQVIPPFSHKFKKPRKYTQYHHDVKLVDEVLDFFKTHEDSSYKLCNLARETNIDSKVLSKWRVAWKKDNSYRPGGKIGYHRRNFTDKQEQEIAELLRIQFIIPGAVVKRKNLLSMFFEFWKSFDLESRSNVKKNFFSYRFITNFCKRHDLCAKRKEVVLMTMKYRNSAKI